MKSRNRVGFVLAGCLLAASPVLAQAPSDDRVKELVRLALEARQGPLVGDAAQPQTIDLKVEDAVAIAAEKNLEIGVERLNPQTIDLSIAGAEGVLPARRITSRIQQQQ